MKISEIHIDKFGSIEDMTLTADEKLNFFYGINEINKKTIIAFIRSVFYGTKNRKNENIRSEFIPEDGSDMSGYIKFTHNDTEYLIERIFSAGKSSRDKITLTDITNDKKENIDPSVVPGIYIFSRNAEFFDRNADMNESESVQLMKTSHSKIMQSMLSNLLTTGFENISVSDISKVLNSYNDTKNKNSLASKLIKTEKRSEALKTELENARNIETDKTELQNNCNQLQKEFRKYNKKYNHLKEEIDYQDMARELDELSNSHMTQSDFIELSSQHEKYKSELKSAGLNVCKNEFDTCCRILDDIKSLQKDEQNLDAQKQKVEVDIGKYTPKENADIHDNILETSQLLEETEENLESLIAEKERLSEIDSQIKEEYLKADFEFQKVQTEYSHFEEISQHKILLAEEKLHSSSYKVDVKPVQKSRNLILASLILIGLALGLVLTIDKKIITIIIVLMMLSLMSSIFAKVSKEKKLNVATRVDENSLREAERNVRNLKNQFITESDKRKTRIASAKRVISEIKDKEKANKKEIESIIQKIEQCKENVAFYQKQKSLSEAKITPPDPKFYTLRSELKGIEAASVRLKEQYYELRDSLFSNVSVIKKVSTPDEAIEFVEKYSAVREKLRETDDKLSMFSDNPEFKMSEEETRDRINKLKEAMKLSKAVNKGKTLSEKELSELKDTAAKLLEQSAEIKNKYVSSITTMKIQYNDSPNAACIERELNILNKKASEIKAKQKVIKAAISAYNDALDEIKSDFIPTIAKRSSEILLMLSGGKYTSVSIKSGKIIVKDEELLPIDFNTISKQSCDQFYLSLRLAVAESSSEEVAFPIILDDIFLNFNESKSAALLKFLIEYANNKQILIFSHHNQIANIASQNEIPLNAINMVSMKKQ